MFPPLVRVVFMASCLDIKRKLANERTLFVRHIKNVMNRTDRHLLRVVLGMLLSAGAESHILFLFVTHDLILKGK